MTEPHAEAHAHAVALHAERTAPSRPRPLTTAEAFAVLRASLRVLALDLFLALPAPIRKALRP